MARDNFISDNLINIREQLRQDQSLTVSDKDTFPQQASFREDEQEKMPPKLPAPAPRMQVRTPELDRERRELIGRITRDYTLVAAELERMEQKKQEAHAFMEFLAKHQKSLETVDFDRSDISRELDRLSWEYYQHSGRWRAFSKGEQQTAVSSETAQHTVSTGSRFTAVSIIISAIIISASILVVFL